MNQSNHGGHAGRPATDPAEAEADIKDHQQGRKADRHQTLGEELPADRRVYDADRGGFNLIAGELFIQCRRKSSLTLGVNSFAGRQREHDILFSGRDIGGFLHGDALSKNFFGGLLEGGSVKIPGVGIGQQRAALELDVKVDPEDKRARECDDDQHDRDCEVIFTICKEVNIPVFHQFLPP